MRKCGDVNQKRQVAERVREIRVNAGLTQEKLAEIMDISLSAYKKVEAGENQISIDCLRKMEQQLNVSSDYILFGKREDLDEVWKIVLNFSEQNKMMLFLRLLNYFTQVKKGKYITKEVQFAYDEQLLEVLKEMDI